MAEWPPVKPSLIGLYARNYIANFSGNFIIVLLNFFTPLSAYEDWQKTLSEGHWVVIPSALISIFTLVTLLQRLVQQPISDVLKKIQSKEKPQLELQMKARRRLLNLPYIMVLVNVTLWIVLTALLMPVMYILINMTVPGFFYGFFRLVMIGVISSFISFFLIDDYCRHRLIPLFFPEGKLALIPGTVKISILRRIRVLFGAGTNAPLILLTGTLAFAVWEIQTSTISAGEFGKQILWFTIVLCLIFIAISLSLNFLVGKSILRPIKGMMSFVRKVRLGDFHQKVPVVSNDELGVLGDGMNEMTEGLIERDQMRESLNLAKEVQQTLLPRKAPRIQWLDIASSIAYCDETGGDYYDFLKGDGSDQGKFAVVVGDVSGHGISAALLMASVRAFLRQRSALSGSIAQIVADVNRLLALDVEDSGGFMTLFYLSIDIAKRQLNWVRAGHEPAIFYDPATDTFEELRGKGTALGVNADAHYLENEKGYLTEGQIILLGTDGLWEARNPAGEMFGKEPIYRLIRENPAASAREILTSCFDALNMFLENQSPDDDITLVVIKVRDL
jgi:sigma-B regulation protein RsbU (phosphoserine phosphatase)